MATSTAPARRSSGVRRTGDAHERRKPGVGELQLIPSEIDRSRLSLRIPTPIPSGFSTSHLRVLALLPHHDSSDPLARGDAAAPVDQRSDMLFFSWYPDYNHPADYMFPIMDSKAIPPDGYGLGFFPTPVSTTRSAGATSSRTRPSFRICSISRRTPSIEQIRSGSPSATCMTIPTAGTTWADSSHSR